MSRSASIATLAIGLAIATAAPVEADQSEMLDRYGGGGVLRSPDGRWRIVSPPVPVVDEETPTATAYLEGPGVRRRLTRYDRLLTAHWPSDRRYVLLNLIDIDWQVPEVHRLAGHETANPKALATAVKTAMHGVRPLLEQADTQAIVFGRWRSGDCLTVEQAGTPKGRNEGSFVVRRAAFQVELAHGRLHPVSRCAIAISE